MGYFVYEMGYLHYICSVIKKQNHENITFIKTHRKKNHHADVLQKRRQSY